MSDAHDKTALFRYKAVEDQSAAVRAVLQDVCCPAGKGLQSLWADCWVPNLGRSYVYYQSQKRTHYYSPN